MERLSEAERVLKYGMMPEDKEALLAFSKQHNVSIAQYFIIPAIHFLFSALGEVNLVKHI